MISIFELKKAFLNPKNIANMNWLELYFSGLDIDMKDIGIKEVLYEKITEEIINYNTVMFNDINNLDFFKELIDSINKLRDNFEIEFVSEIKLFKLMLDEKVYIKILDKKPYKTNSELLNEMAQACRVVKKCFIEEQIDNPNMLSCTNDLRNHQISNYQKNYVSNFFNKNNITLEYDYRNIKNFYKKITKMINQYSEKDIDLNVDFKLNHKSMNIGENILFENIDLYDIDALIILDLMSNDEYITIFKNKLKENSFVKDCNEKIVSLLNSIVYKQMNMDDIGINNKSIKEILLSEVDNILLLDNLDDFLISKSILVFKGYNGEFVYSLISRLQEKYMSEKLIEKDFYKNLTNTGQCKYDVIKRINSDNDLINFIDKKEKLIEKYIVKNNGVVSIFELRSLLYINETDCVNSLKEIKLLINGLRSIELKNKENNNNNYVKYCVSQSEMNNQLDLNDWLSLPEDEKTLLFNILTAIIYSFTESDSNKIKGVSETTKKLLDIELIEKSLKNSIDAFMKEYRIFKINQNLKMYNNINKKNKNKVKI